MDDPEFLGSARTEPGGTPIAEQLTPDGWRRIKHIAARAWDVPEADRPALIAALCRGDTVLHARVETLLRHASAASNLYEVPAVTMPGGAGAVAAAVSVSPPILGARIGPYRIVRELGRGGMGAVYLGERADGEFEQRVAIKLLGGVASEPLLRRFKDERRILASFNHPHISVLLDGGSIDGGLPYLIMEYVEGEPIDVYCERQDIGVRERIALFQHVCDAVHHAHQRHVIHRDIKASNILVTATGTPKLLDFGIAKIVTPSDHSSSQTIVRALTLESASPEQARGELVSIASDVYALGVLLYRLLTGHSPYGQPSSEAALVRAICEETPDPPSVVIRRQDGWGGRSPIDRDLDLIVLKALRKEPARRYLSAREFSEDLSRCLEGRPVVAAADSWRYRARAVARRHRRVLAAAAVALIALVGGAMAALWVLGRATGPGTTELRSVVVLPFKAITTPANPEDEYLGTALADALITELSALKSANIRPLNPGRLRNDHPVDVGRELGATLVLDGAIQRAADRLRVNVYLIRTADAATVWSDRVDVPWTDVFAVQDIIADQVTRALAVSLTSEDRQRVLRRRTGNFEAYEAYLRGRYFWNLRTSHGLQKALTYFQQAIARDGRYAPAYAGLADTYALLGSMPSAVLPPREAGEKAKEAAVKALELDETLAEAQVSLAFAICSFDWDWAGGEEHFRRAIELDPDYATAHHWYSLYLGQVGRVDEALLEAQRALDLEPLSLVGTYVAGLAHYSARRFDLARQYAEKALEVSPTFPLAGRLLGKVDILEGRYQDAVVQCRRQYENERDNSMSAALLAHAYARAGQLTEARRLLKELVEQASTGYVSPVNVAIGFIGLDDKDAAFEWLERGYAERSQGLTFLNNEPIFDPLRSDPRFASLLRRVGLAPSN